MGTSSKKSFVLLLVSLSILYLLCNLKRDFWYPDEPDVAEITREMLESGNWIHLTLSDKTFADYPHLFFWLAGVAAMIGGMSEFMFRLPSTLSAIGLLILVWFWARRKFDEQTALWSSAVLGTTYFFTSEATHMHVDMTFSFFFSGSLLFFWFFHDARTTPKRILLAALASLFMGLASLTKGPAGLVLPLGIMGTYALVRRQWRELIPIAFIGIGGIFIFLAWSLLYAQGVGEADLSYFIYKQNIDRFLSGWSHHRPVYYYFINIWSDLTPWSLSLIPAIYVTWKQARQNREGALFLLIWFTVVFLFFTLSRSKRNVYILPLYPAAAVMIGNFLTSVFRRGYSPRSFSIVFGMTAFLFLVAGAGLAVFMGVPHYRQQIPFPISYLPVGVTSALFLMGGSFALFEIYRRRTLQTAIGIALSAGMIYGVMLGWFFPTLDNPLSARQDAEWIKSYINEHETIGFFAPRHSVPNEATSIEYYSERSISALVNQEDIEKYFYKQPGDSILVLDKDLKDFQSVYPGAISIKKELIIGSDVLYAVEVASFGGGKEK